MYAPLGSQKRQVSAKLLRTRSTFSKSVMVSVAMSVLETTELTFIESGVKINGAYYRDVLLGQHLLPAIHSVAGDFGDTVEFLSRNTPDFISPLPWPPNSSDLNLVDYEVWGVLQQQVYHSRIRDVDHLKQRLIDEWRCFDHHWPSSSTLAYMHMCPCKRWPLWAQTVTDVFVYELLRRLFHIGNFCFWVPFLKQLLLRNCAVDFVEICNVYIRKMITKAAKRIFNSDKICRSYSDLNFGVTFLDHNVHKWPTRLYLTLLYHNINCWQYYPLSKNNISCWQCWPSTRPRCFERLDTTVLGGRLSTHHNHWPPATWIV